MASKLEQTVAYIRDMEIGRRVSIKQIAHELSISEGTAYHAIKRAEQQGLVVTLPKVGTTRVQPSARPKPPTMTLAALSALVNAAPLSGESLLDMLEVTCFCVGDGSEDDLLNQLDGGTGTVCILGNRPELQMPALSHGAHLVLTDRTPLTAEAGQMASSQKRAVLQTSYSTFHVLSLLGNSREHNFPMAFPMVAREWMQPPKFLYLDDLIIDGNRMFESCHLSDIPVVDNDMHICGALTEAKAFSMEPSQRIKNVYERGDFFQVVEESDLMVDAADRMLSGGYYQILVQKDGCLTGMLTQGDILKFYQYYGVSMGGDNQSYLFEPMSTQPIDGKQIYFVRVPLEPEGTHTLAGERVISLLISAAGLYCRAGGRRGALRSITYFANNPVPPASDLFVSVEGTGSSDDGYVMLECVLYSDTCSYGKASFLVVQDPKI